ncbi:hypothetical protein [Coleofasciculus sp. FACHB-1120]|uniref:hypothetical protein n=1 Tax=Coleofasciculus sp. FACHB-1120 TaxID=2692783 RepID=UPI0016820DDA|nr:hypothetical protein [Coleofasciculus sp. FACHB-1120]MBD2740068.1 hypothetical protein [Coleofasciculus sp. FACHB-1120]
MTSTVSSIEDLIRNHNVFDGHQVVKKSQVWGKSFPEVSAINAHASDAVFEAIRQVRTGQCQVRGITIRADRGLGKTHIISRIRQRLQTEGSAFFVYMAEYEDLNQIKSEFLQTLASSLKQVGSQNVMQWQELAAALVSEVSKKSYTPKDLINKFLPALAKDPKLVNNLTNKVILAKPDIDPYIIRAIVWTLSQLHAPFAIKWLAGEELAQLQAEAMGLPTIAVDSSKTLCYILDIISDYKTPLLCFDELDSAAGCDDKGFTRAQVVASFVKDLYNQIKRGVLLTTIYPATWEAEIAYMSDANAVIDRMAEFSSGKPIDLRNLNSDEVVALVSQRLKKLCDEHGITLPYPVYPFDEGELRKLGKQGLTARELLTWCAEKIKKGKDNRVELAFKEELEGLADFLEDEAKIAQALIFAFNTIIGKTIDRVKVDKIEAPVKPRTNCIDFKIIGEEDSNVVKIGVAVIQASGGVGIKAGLKALTEYKTYDLTRGCFVRSKTIPPKAVVAEQYRKQLVEQQGGEWVKLMEEEIKPLIAIWAVYQKHESLDLSESQIFNFITEKELTVNNPLIREILSDPSGQTPEGLVDEDALFEEASTILSKASQPTDDSHLDALLASIMKE